MKFLDVNIDATKIIEQLQKIADPTVKHLLEVYGKQAVVQGHVDITVGYWLFGFAAAFIVVGIALWVFDIIRDWEGIGFGFGTCAIVVGLILSLAGVYNLIQDLINQARGQ